MELMNEWDALDAELVRVRAEKASDGALPKGRNAQPSDAEAALLTRMQALKQRIDAFLGKAARERQPVSGPLVMGTLVSAASTPADAPDKPSRETPTSSGDESE